MIENTKNNNIKSEKWWYKIKQRNNIGFQKTMVQWQTKQ